jgi:oleate hydratase
LLSIVAFHQPHFINQPKDVSVIWGYSLFGDRIGDYIKKPMSECSGEEILREVCYHLGFIDEMDEIVDSAINVIPAMIPYITSQFMPRSVGDRPEVVPQGVKNFAFLGQFAEVKDECVFTVEYSIKSAMIAVYKLLNLEKEPPETYKGQYDIRVLNKAINTLIGENRQKLEYSIRNFLGL